MLAVQSFVHLSMLSSCSSSINSRSTEGENDHKNAKWYLTETKPTCSDKCSHNVSTTVPETFDIHSWNVADIWYATELQSDDD